MEKQLSQQRGNEMASQKRKGLPTLGRKIYFYRINIGRDDDGLPLSFDPKPYLATINQLPFTEDINGRYLAGFDGEAVCGWVDDNQDELSHMRFGLIRRAGLPQIEESGNLSDLNIATNAGLAEPIHIVFFSENIVGVDFNFHGPRLSRLGYYFNMKCGQHFPVGMFSPLLRNDVLQQLDRLGDVRLFDLKVRTSYAETLHQADADLGSAFAAAQRIGDAEEVEVIIRPAKGSRASTADRLIAMAKRLAGHSDIRSESSRFVIKGKRDDSGKVETIDLLHDQLITKKQIVRMSERSRALDKNSAYDAITTAYKELEEELKSSSSISSC